MDNSINTSWINNDKEYADIISFYDQNTSRSNLLSFIKTNILEKAGCSNSGRAVGGTSFLDIGPATGEVTKELSNHFGRTDVLEPNKTHAEALKRLGCNVSHDYWQDASIEKDQYDLILAAHMLYFVPSHLWEMCFLKAYEGLKPGGCLVIVMNAPHGQFEDIRKSISGLVKTKLPGPDARPNSHAVLRCLQKMDLPTRTEETTFKVTASSDDVERMYIMLRMFIATTCNHLEDCIGDDRAYLEREIMNRAKELVDPATRTCTLNMDEDIMIVQKPN